MLQPLSLPDAAWAVKVNKGTHSGRIVVRSKPDEGYVQVTAVKEIRGTAVKSSNKEPTNAHPVHLNGCRIECIPRLDGEHGPCVIGSCIISQMSSRL